MAPRGTSSSTSRTTTDHDEIRRWAEERGAKPAAVQRSESEDEPGVIRLDFPGYNGEGSLEEIGWDEWFQKFDESNLALLYQGETAGGERSNFNKLVSRQTAQQASRRGGSSRSTRSSSGARGRSGSQRSSSRGSSSGRQASSHSGSSSRRANSSSRSKSRSGGRSR